MLGQRGTCLPPQIQLLPPLPQIQKLADRSVVISEVPKCSKIQINDYDNALGSLQRSPRLPS